MAIVAEILREMTFEFFGSGGHKIEPEALFAAKDAILLDVRAPPEQESIQLKLRHHIRVLWIPTEQVPDRLAEIPRNVPIGVFCTTGFRSAVVWLYLRAKGYENVRVVLGGYEALTSLLLPGRLLNWINRGAGSE